MSTPSKRQKAYRAGVWAETYCAFVLRCKGYRILDQRFRSGTGEIDLIAKKGEVIVFVEVKQRPSLEAAKYAIDARAQERIRRTAESYLARQFQGHVKGRFDAMLVLPWGRVKHIKNAWH
jgi:putative endonuclease